MGLWMFEIDHILETVVENEYNALLANCLFPPPHSVAFESLALVCQEAVLLTSVADSQNESSIAKP